MLKCPSHDNTDDLKYHADEIFKAFRAKTQESIQQETRTINQVLKCFGKVTGGAVITTIVVAGMMPIFPMINSGLPAAFATSALMNWATEIGKGAVGDWIVETSARWSKSDWKGSGSKKKKEEWIFSESEHLLREMTESDIELAAGISKIIRDNELIDVYSQALQDLDFNSEMSSGKKEVYNNIKRGIFEARQIVNCYMFEKFREIHEENNILRTENQLLKSNKQELNALLQGTFQYQYKMDEIQASINQLSLGNQYREKYERLEEENRELRTDVDALKSENSRLQAEIKKMIKDASKSVGLGTPKHSSTSPPTQWDSPPPFDGMI